MLTQAMPALAQALRGVIPDNAVRQLMQALGNCNQPLVHRGPVSIQPQGPQQNGPGFYNGQQWDPNQFRGLIDANNIYNNNSFIDATSTGYYFGGDQFSFPTYTTNEVTQTFINNFFPQDPSGGFGRDGRDGRDGAPGTGGGGRDGRDGSPGGGFGGPGRRGPSGPPGNPGRPGESGSAGPAGPPGEDARGRPGRDGRDGRNGASLGYELEDLKPKVRYATIPRVSVGPNEVCFSVPEFNPDTCETTEKQICIAVPDISVENESFHVYDPPFHRLRPKPFWP